MSSHHHHHPESGPPGSFDDSASRGRGRRHGPRGRGRRAARGDVRTAILTLLADEPMHGYQLMQAIAERSGYRWNPSPGAIYPAISQLEDEGLVRVAPESGRKVVTLTDAGRQTVANGVTGDPFAPFDEADRGPDLRSLMVSVIDATRQIGRRGTTAQAEAAASVLRNTRRELYLLLADGSDDTEG